MQRARLCDSRRAGAGRNVRCRDHPISAAREMEPSAASAMRSTTARAVSRRYPLRRHTGTTTRSAARLLAAANPWIAPRDFAGRTGNSPLLDFEEGIDRFGRPA